MFSQEVARNYKNNRRCPSCFVGWDKHKTLDEESGWGEDGYVSRMVCLKCGKRWDEIYTLERIEECD